MQYNTCTTVVGRYDTAILTGFYHDLHKAEIGSGTKCNSWSSGMFGCHCWIGRQCWFH